MEFWIEEWLFRGRPPSGPDSEKLPSCQIIIGKQVDDPFNPGKLLRQLSNPISPDQLPEYGFSAEDLITSFNLEALKTIAQLQSELSSLKNEIIDSPKDESN